MTVTADDLKKLRDLTGEGLLRCREAAELASDPAQPFDGDLLWALCTLAAGAFAVNIKPPSARTQWNLDRGARDAADLRERDPAIAETFPAKGATRTP